MHKFQINSNPQSQKFQKDRVLTNYYKIDVCGQRDLFENCYLNFVCNLLFVICFFVTTSKNLFSL